MYKEFKIICKECGCSDVSIEEEIDYDWEENPYTSGHYLYCNRCANSESI